jgi:hypothetical protein
MEFAAKNASKSISLKANFNLIFEEPLVFSRNLTPWKGLMRTHLLHLPLDPAALREAMMSYGWSCGIIYSRVTPSPWIQVSIRLHVS